MITRIGRRATAYSTEVDEFLALPVAERRGPREQQLVDSLTDCVEFLLGKYDPPGLRRRSDGLVFDHIYEDAFRMKRIAGSGVTDLLAAFLAAEVEYRGPLRLSRAQNRELGAVYERLGIALRDPLPAHAALAFRRAASQYYQDEDKEAQDRCHLRMLRARRRTQPVRWRRIASVLPDLICGYGFTPFRMLFWVAAQLIVFTTIVCLGSDQAVMSTIYECLANYLNPLGPSDTAGLEGAARLIFVLEAYTGLLTTSVFFALLVRRWFRL